MLPNTPVAFASAGPSGATPEVLNISSDDDVTIGLALAAHVCNGCGAICGAGDADFLKTCPVESEFGVTSGVDGS